MTLAVTKGAILDAQTEPPPNLVVAPPL